MEKAWIALSLCLCVGIPRPANSEIFTRETLQIKPENLDRTVDATLKIEKVDVGGLCTAVAVSPDGYVLTNLHCVMPCLEDNDLLSRKNFTPLVDKAKIGVVDVEIDEDYSTERVASSEGGVVDVITTTQNYRIARTVEQAPEKVVCDNYRLSIRHEFYNAGAWDTTEQFFYGARVVWLGRSSMTFSDEHISGFTDRVVQELRDGWDDFAILKFELPHSVACMPVSPVDAKYGDRVWVVGYPMFAERDSGFHSPGYRRAISFGRVRGSIAEDPYLRNLVEDFEMDLGDNRDPLTGKPKRRPKLELTVADWLRLLPIYENPRILLTDLDAMPGNSGSMIINKDGDVVALLRGGVAYSTKKHLRATVSGLRIGVILDEVKQGLGEKKFREIFSCPAEDSDQKPRYPRRRHSRRGRPAPLFLP